MKPQELVKVTLQNEMDLIIAHRRSMRLAELTGLSLPAQTTFATAVSEVARHTIEHGHNGCLTLSIQTASRKGQIIAHITDEHPEPKNNEGLEYAKRLVNRYETGKEGESSTIDLFFVTPSVENMDAALVDEWRSLFRNEPAISAYEEIKRKNEQLQELSQKLKDSEEQYRTLTNALPLLIFSMNEKGELTYANEWLKKLTGSSLTYLNSTRWKEVIHQQDYDSFLQLLQAAAGDQQQEFRIQCRIRNRNSEEYFWHLLSISPVADEEKKLLYWIGYLVNIHAQKIIEETLQDNRELKEAQAQLKSKKEELEENIRELNRSNRELQEFAYVASHDLQEPIRKIGFYSDFLIEKYGSSFDTKGLEYMQNMQAASVRMRNLVHDLLAFAQVERAAVQYKQVDLAKVVTDVIGDLEILIEEKKASVEVGELPGIEADGGMMHQLIENLLGNAIKYAKADVQPLIRISASQKDQWLQLHISDNGIGFDEKYLPQMFTLFKRLHPAARYEGTGLGLAICQKIVALHGGTITAVSEPGKGATFTVNLPVNRSAHAKN